MENYFRLEIGKGACNSFGITYVAADESELWVRFKIPQRGKISGVGQFVENQDLVALAHQQSRQV